MQPPKMGWNNYPLGLHYRFAAEELVDYDYQTRIRRRRSPRTSSPPAATAVVRRFLLILASGALPVTSKKCIFIRQNIYKF